MSTKRSHFLFIVIKVTRVGIPLVLPMHIFWECIDALEDIFWFAGQSEWGKKARKALYTAVETVWMLCDLGRFELVDVEAGNKVKVKVGLR